MKARLRIIVAACFLLTAGAPALAQEAGAPPQNEVVGPPQLRDFTLNGTVTRPAPPPASEQPRQQPPARQQPTPAPRTPPQATSPDSSAPSRDVTQPAREQPQSSAGDRVDLPPPPPPPEPSFDAGEAAATAPPPPDEAESFSGLSILPWILVALAGAGAAAWFFLRQRPRESFAGVGESDLFEAPPPPAPAAARPVEAPLPPEPKPVATGVVSSRLRPWLELEFTPERGVIDHEKAMIGFELSVYNSGSVPARNVLLLAALINGGPMQEQQIRLFFDNPGAGDDRIPVIPPLQRVTLNTRVVLAREQIRPIEVEGRQLFVPMVAFNAIYGWSGGTGQTSASYLVGKQTSGEKLAPFRLDLGSRIFRNLAAREHEYRIRK